MKQGLRKIFFRASGPLALAGTVALGGCGTAAIRQIDHLSCEETETVSALPPAAGDGLRGGVTGQAFVMQSVRRGLNPDCEKARDAVRLGLMRDPATGVYSIPNLIILRTYYTQADDGVRGQIASRLALEGLSPDDLDRLIRSRGRNFECRSEGDGSRRCVLR